MLILIRPIREVVFDILKMSHLSRVQNLTHFRVRDRVRIN